MAWLVGPTVGGFVARLLVFRAVRHRRRDELHRRCAVLLVHVGNEAGGARASTGAGFLETFRNYRIVLRDKAYVAFLVAAVLMGMVYIQMYNSLSVYLRDNHGIEPQGYGFLLTSSAITVICFQFWTMRIIKMRPQFLMMALGTVFYLIGFGMFGVVSAYWLFVLAVVIITIGEMIVMPTSQALAAGLRADGHARALHGGLRTVASACRLRPGRWPPGWCSTTTARIFSGISVRCRVRRLGDELSTHCTCGSGRRAGSRPPRPRRDRADGDGGRAWVTWKSVRSGFRGRIRVNAGRRSALTTFADAQPRVTLPKGVKSVSFGTAHRYFGPGKEMCVIVFPLPGAVFERGITELSYAVELEPRTVKKASAQRDRRHAAAACASVACNVFTPVPGGFSQTQIGNTISRADKAPLASGRVHAPHQRRRPDRRRAVQYQIRGQTPFFVIEEGSDPFICMYPRALLLDLDDTILDDSGLVHECWRSACADHADRLRSARRGGGRRCDQNSVAMVLGRCRAPSHRPSRARTPRGARSCGSRSSSWASRTRRSQTQSATPTAIGAMSAWTPLPDAIDTVRWLRDSGRRLALLTNGGGPAQRKKIVRFGLAELFDVILIEGELGFGKPDERVYHRALAALRRAASEAWMVGDNLEWDVGAPQKLGISGVWIDVRGRGVPEHGHRPARLHGAVAFGIALVDCAACLI